jgi:small conductance mechanosensitive channel
MDNIQITADWANRNIGSILLGVLTCILILAIGSWLARKLTQYAARSMTRAKMDVMVIGFLEKLIYIIAMLAVIITALNAVGIQTTSLTALLASAGLAIGLALKDSLSNLASGVMILVFRPYAINHIVDAAGTSGSVEQVQIFSTILRTPDNIQVIVPNSAVIRGNIKNYSAYENRRVEMTAKIRYEDNIGAARELVMDIIRAHPLALPDPSPTVEVQDLTELNTTLLVRLWARTEDFWQVRCEILEKIKMGFDENGFNLPMAK